jgi:protein transport protein SEC61 subunit gamma-like protein
VTIVGAVESALSLVVLAVTRRTAVPRFGGSPATFRRHTVLTRTNRYRKPDRKRSDMQVPKELGAYTRVLKLASTPSWEEFSRVALIAGAGVVLVGILGFVIFVVMNFMPGGV